jgi:glycosyltransferase involved in cell wall biosynthesis
MQIALVNSEIPAPGVPGHGGIASFTYTLANALAQQNHRVHVCVVEGTTVTESFHANVQVHTVRWKPRSGPLRYFTRHPVEFHKGLSRGLYELLHRIYRTDGLDIVDIPEYNGLAAQFPRRRPFPFVITFHTPTYLVDELNNATPDSTANKVYQLEGKALTNAEGYKSPSQALLDIVRSHYRLAGSVPAAVIKYPCDPALFNIIPRPPKKDDFFHILFSGRLERRKGADILCNNLQDILGISTRIHLTVAGQSNLTGLIDYREKMENSLDDRQREQVWMLGPQDRQKLPAIYCNSDVFLMPSLFDNAPYALLEAMSARLPIVAADTGGINEIIRHDENGLLFPLSRPEEMVAHIRTIYTDPDRALSLAQHAERTIAREHDITTTTRDTVSFYQRIVRRGT